MDGTVMRHQIADYLNTGTTETPVYSFMGIGFNTLDENPNAQTDSKTYISQKSQTSYVKSYQTQFPFDTDLIVSQEAVMALYEIGRDQKTGADAELEYIRVDLFIPVEGEGSANIFKARKFKVTASVTSIAGAGGETVKVTGTLFGVGDAVQGTFNTSTKAFTPTV